MTDRICSSINIQKEHLEPQADMLKDEVTTTAMAAAGTQWAVLPGFNLLCHL